MPVFRVCSACAVECQQGQPVGVSASIEDWCHLDGSPLCPAGVPTPVEDFDRTAPDAVEFLATVRDAFPPDGKYTAMRMANAMAVAASVATWLREATVRPRDEHAAPSAADLADLLSTLLPIVRSQADTMANLSQYIRGRATADDPADAALAGRAGTRLAHAATLQRRAAADLAACWIAARHRSGAGAGRVCGCPPACACCGAAVGAGHDDECPWRLGSARHEQPFVAPEPAVLAGHTHRPGCPRAVRRPGGLSDYINDDGDVHCVTCAAVNTIDHEHFESRHGTAEHHHQRCTACGIAWSWCNVHEPR
jgi:hypothetical protein